jgi:GIY-YIG catalytic domain-containing protein
MFVYVIVNSATLKIYVGQHKGTNLRQYLQQKLHYAHRRLKEHSYLYAAMRKYPREVWSIHPLVSGLETRTEVDESERHFIRVLKTQHSDVGYNICRGGEGHTGPLTEEAKRKIGEKSRAWRASLTEEERQEHNRKTGAGQVGRVQSPKAIEAARQAKLGVSQTPEHLQKRSAGMKAVIAAGYTPYRFTPEEHARGCQASAAKITGVPRPPEVMAAFHSPEAQARAIANSRITNAGKPKSPEVRARMSEGLKKSWALRKKTT